MLPDNFQYYVYLLDWKLPCLSFTFIGYFLLYFLFILGKGEFPFVFLYSFSHFYFLLSFPLPFPCSFLHILFLPLFMKFTIKKRKIIYFWQVNSSYLSEEEIFITEICKLTFQLVVIQIYTIILMFLTDYKLGWFFPWM